LSTCPSKARTIRDADYEPGDAISIGHFADWNNDKGGAAKPENRKTRKQDYG
jgi:hypothetical protein